MTDPLKTESRRVNAIAVFTLLAVLLYGGGALWSMIQGQADFKDFSAAMGPLTGLLVGYWVRGTTSQ